MILLQLKLLSIFDNGHIDNHAIILLLVHVQAKYVITLPGVKF